MGYTHMEQFPNQPHIYKYWVSTKRNNFTRPCSSSQWRGGKKFVELYGVVYKNMQTFTVIVGKHNGWYLHICPFLMTFTVTCQWNIQRNLPNTCHGADATQTGGFCSLLLLLHTYFFSSSMELARRSFLLSLMSLYTWLLAQQSAACMRGCDIHDSSLISLPYRISLPSPLSFIPNPPTPC